MAAHEHEILLSFVVATNRDKRAAQDWLMNRLHDADAYEDGDVNWRGPVGDSDETHVDSYWVAEDDRSDADAQQGLRSAVYVPEPLTQREASGILADHVSDIRRNEEAVQAMKDAAAEEDLHIQRGGVERLQQRLEQDLRPIKDLNVQRRMAIGLVREAERLRNMRPDQTGQIDKFIAIVAKEVFDIG